jgi:hypothetical protein
MFSLIKQSNKGILLQKYSLLWTPGKRAGLERVKIADGKGNSCEIIGLYSR